MARGRAPGYDMQREEILARAAELFARNGFQGTSMNDVAEACGVSKAALYHYVRDKTQLLAEIAMAHVARLRTLVAEVQGLDLPPEPRARLLIERFVAAYADAQNDHRVLTEDVRFMQPDDRKRVLEGQREVVAAFAEAIAGVRPDVGPARLAKPLTMLLFGMINWTFTWLQPKGHLRHADVAPMVADLFFGGLGAVGLPASASDPADNPLPARKKTPRKETAL
jgi:AcrR family transcriptional regulator